MATPTLHNPSSNTNNIPLDPALIDTRPPDPPPADRPHDHDNGHRHTQHHHHHQHHHQNPISKLVGRLRATSGSEASLPASTTPPHSSLSSSSSESDSVKSGQSGRSSSSSHRIRTPRFKLPGRGGAGSSMPDVAGGNIIAGERGAHRDPMTGSPGRRHAQAPDADLSLELWNRAYDALRDNPRTAGLVVAYEGIVSQELPDHLKLGGLNSTLRDHPDSKRMDLVLAIAENGLKRRRPSKASQTSDKAKAVVNISKDTISNVLQGYPSAALAWCGLCTLTPLLLDPIIQRTDMRLGIFHVTGRIAWYTHLPRLLLRESWHSEGAFRASRDDTRDALYQLYRKVLEFEMVCVCATASAWNTAAKNVVEWQGVGGLRAAIAELDEQLKGVVEGEAVEAAVRRRLLADYRDLEVGEVEPEGQKQAEDA